MTEEVQSRRRRPGRLGFAVFVLAVLVGGLIVPPLMSMSRYRSRITQLMAESLGRPVGLSSVELRLLPVPAFVLTDLSVAEDPAYGAEPVLQANTVKASIRLLSLWRGRLEIGTISVDEASLNVVRTPDGRWNLDPLFRTAAARAQPAAGSLVDGGTVLGLKRRIVPLPYLEATSLRINFKRGPEKLPFSLVESELSFWQEQPGVWRIRLRGQPARTDVSLDLADTGLVRLEARVQQAPELRRMPVHLDLEWREAQLGQLARLLIGSDPGWRGDLTGELHMDGTADAARIRTRLRATGVHRAEFAPAAPMDFDASCGFLYRYTARAVEGLACDSPLGDGRIHVAGDLPGNGQTPHVSVELDRVPVAAGLDALRTVRSDFGPGLEAQGLIHGKISYAGISAQPVVKEKPARAMRGRKGHAGKADPAEPGPLTGSLTVEGFQLRGQGLSAPIGLSRLVLEPVAEDGALPGDGVVRLPAAALETTVTIPAGGASPLTLTARLALSGYRTALRGPASMGRARELAGIAGVTRLGALDELTGEPVTVDLTAAGPWRPAQEVPFGGFPRPAPSSDAAGRAVGARPDASAALPANADTLSGTVTLRNAKWKAGYLANPVEIAQGTLSIENGEMRLDPVVFTYGPVRGTASLDLPAPCAAAAACEANFNVRFAELDAAALQAAMLGAHEPGPLLSSLLARLKPGDASGTPAWPTLQGTVKADALTLGPVTLTGAVATVRIVPTGAEIKGLDAELLGGRLHAEGSLRAATGEGKPAYTLEGQFTKLRAEQVGLLLKEKWSGGALDAEGRVELSGFTDRELAASARGTLHFDWRHGAVAGPDRADAIPAELARFDRWTGDADVGNGTVTLRQNAVERGVRKRMVAATVTLGGAPKVSFGGASEGLARR